uniref:Exosome complex component CSL4 n=1 Tax=Globodera rostochiensis TaxID=31243 RepID=A0A914GXY0_GLORO
MDISASFLDSILPGFSGTDNNGNCEKRACIPGELLFSVADGYHAGNGCYEFHGSVFASLSGFVHVFSLKDSQNAETNIVEVRRNFDERNHVLPSQAKIVTARVELITTKFAKCSIICVEDTALVNGFNSTLRKEDVREKERDKVELHKFVQPGDIILARVLGYGEAHTSYLLTIAEAELGVVIGRGQNGERLLPENSELMKMPGSEYREIRKVAQLPTLNK